MTDNDISSNLDADLDGHEFYMRSSSAKASQLREALPQFHAVWRNRQQQFGRYSPVPFWAPGLALNSAIRESFERYLPISEYCQDLARLACLILPSPNWVPSLLRHPCLNPIHDGTSVNLHSLPDFWNLLPQHFQGHILYTEEELLPLFCAIADLNRFGTAANRYPEQQQHIRELSRARSRACWRLLDLGCGTGEGTYELARLVQQENACLVQVLGITREPLEAWMANRQLRPHQQRQVSPLISLSSLYKIPFLAGNVLRLPVRSGCFDIILANGLVGGPYLRQIKALEMFYQELELTLAQDGFAAFANHFHDGCQSDLDLVVDLARQRGWQIVGHRHNLLLTRHSGLF